MNITIDTIHLENFKGASDLSVEFAPGRTDIYGDNATGKTTLFDAFTWLLFGKDSSNASLFAIKPLDGSGAVRDHALVTSVTATIDVDGVKTELRKEYRERWTKKRGSAQATFSGNETKCYIDGIPKAAKAFSEFVRSLADEKTFRMLTDPHYFATVLTWQDRRDLLMQLGGGCTDADVLSTNPEFGDVGEFILKHGVEDALSKLKADRTRTNKALDLVPVRIDEAYKQIRDDPDVGFRADGYNAAEDMDVIAALETRIAEIEGQIAGVRAGMVTPKIAQLQRKIAEAQQDAERMQAAYTDAYAAYSKEKTDAQAGIDLNERALASARAAISRIRADITALRGQYAKVRDEKWTGSDVCPTCGQKIPEDMIEAHRSEFNVRRSERLMELTQRGQQLNTELQEQEQMADKIQRAIDLWRDTLESLTEPDRPAMDTPELQALRYELAETEANAAAAAKEDLEQLEGMANDLSMCRWRAMQRLMRGEALDRSRERIAELEEDEKKLSRELEDIDRRIALCEQFIRTKVDLAEQRINSMFRIASFKLYDTQINGGINPCCELQVNGVTWDNLNSGMRILAGCDIISAISAHLGISAPVFLDNAEGLTVAPTLDGSQLIRLVVSEPDKSLRVEAVA